MNSPFLGHERLGTVSPPSLQVKPDEGMRHLTVSPNRRSGQVMVFFIMIVVLLTLTALWNFDLQKLFRVKSITQNGGDAAALMAARWQAISLNLAGDLNLLQVIALSEGDNAALSAISNLQVRLRFTGPMTALMAAQQAAKNNGLHINPDYTAFLHEHARNVADNYGTEVGEDGELLFPEPWPGAWMDYSRMIASVADNGVAAAPDNLQLYTDRASGGHLLYDIAFYEAVAGRNWCWFHANAPTLLQDYQNFFPAWWSPLPEPPRRSVINSEIYGMHLSTETRPLTGFGISSSTAGEMALERGLSGMISAAAMTTTVAWVTYGEAWGEWSAASTSGEDPFPFAGPVRPAFNYAGADASVRVEATAGRLTPGSGGASISNTLTWTAAAKPFGSLEGDLLPTRFSLVLPAYRDVRLIPVDTSSGSSSGGFNLAWRDHIEKHLDDYMAGGPTATPSSCWYCRQLRSWERESLRQSGVAWLRVHSASCRPVGGGGGDASGGRRRGH